MGVLRAARPPLVTDGSVLVADERVADAFTAPAAAGFTGFEVLPIDNPLWRFYRMYG